MSQLSLAHARTHKNTFTNVCIHTMVHTKFRNIYTELYHIKGRGAQEHPLVNLMTYPQWSKEFNQENEKV